LGRVGPACVNRGRPTMGASWAQALVLLLCRPAAAITPPNTSLALGTPVAYFVRPASAPTPRHRDTPPPASLAGRQLPAARRRQHCYAREDAHGHDREVGGPVLDGVPRLEQLAAARRCVSPLPPPPRASLFSPLTPRPLPLNMPPGAPPPATSRHTSSTRYAA